MSPLGPLQLNHFTAYTLLPSGIFGYTIYQNSVWNWMPQMMLPVIFIRMSSIYVDACLPWFLSTWFRHHGWRYNEHSYIFHACTYLFNCIDSRLTSKMHYWIPWASFDQAISINVCKFFATTVDQILRKMASISLSLRYWLGSSWNLELVAIAITGSPRNMPSCSVSQ